MNAISSIRCTINPASITEDDVLDAVTELVDDADGMFLDVAAVADALDLPRDHLAITRRVMTQIAELQSGESGDEPEVAGGGECGWGTSMPNHRR